MSIVQRFRRIIQVLTGKIAPRTGPVDGYGTHFVPLAAAVQLTRGAGPVLELGLGYYSTPLLHLMCRDGHLVSAETNAEWLRRFTGFATPTHEIHLVEDWSRWPVIESRRWAVALVDCTPVEARAELVLRLKSHAHFIVVHDTETDHGAETDDYNLEPVFATFRYRSDYRFLRPYTTIVSDEAPFPLSEVDTIWPNNWWLGLKDSFSPPRGPGGTSA